MSTPSRRAAPLPADERRAAVLAATVPLIRQHGYAVTTRQIAAAAGVAEGTLFRVFPDKDTLIRAAVRSAFAPEPLLADIARIDRAVPLEARLTAIATVLHRRIVESIQLMTAVGMRRPPDDERRERGSPRRPPQPPLHGPILDAIAELLEPDRDILTRTPQDVARLLRLLTFAGSHAGINDGQPLTPQDIVSVLLDGVRRHDNVCEPCSKPSNPSSTSAESKADRLNSNASNASNTKTSSNGKRS